MRSAVLSLMLLGVASCHRQAPPPREPERSAVGDVVAPLSEPPGTGEKVANAQALSPDPANDRALAGLSPNRRRDYDRGYRDCTRGTFNYDPDRQGEFYRIGCMAAENAKAGTEP